MDSEGDENADEFLRGLNPQKKDRGRDSVLIAEDDQSQRSRLSDMIVSVFNQCHTLNITTGLDFAITFQNRVRLPGQPNHPASKDLVYEARSKCFNKKLLSVAEHQKEPYSRKDLQPNYCMFWTVFGEFDSTSDLNPEETTPSATEGEEWQPDGDGKLLCTPGVFVRDYVSLSATVKPETELLETLEEQIRCDQVQSFSESCVIKQEEQLHSDGRLGDERHLGWTFDTSDVDAENPLETFCPLEVPLPHCKQQFLFVDASEASVSVNFDDETIGGNRSCGIPKQTFPVESSGVSDINNSTSSRPIGPIDSRSCGVSAVAGIVNGSMYCQQNQESLVEATGAGYDKLVTVDASSSNSVNTVMDTGEILLRCDHCQKKFREVNKLRSHIIVHLNEGNHKPSTCESCDKSFFPSKHCNRHIITDAVEKPFTCKYCDRKFARTEDRDQHGRTHTGEKPFKCDLCDKSFAQSSARNAHVRTHTGEKRYSCEFCPRTFAYSGGRSRHMRVHAGEGLSKCDLCDKSFFTASGRKKHMIIHTRETL